MTKVLCNYEDCEYNYYGKIYQKDEINIVEVEIATNEFAPICASTSVEE